jgi:hypothetical protein
MRTILILLFSGFVAAFCAQETSDSMLTFKIRSVLTAQGKTLNNYRIILSYEGGYTDTINCPGGLRKIFTTLKKNEIYTLIFQKEGFENKMVVIDTRMPDSVDTTFPFVLDFEIEVHPSCSRQFSELSDFPVAYYRFYSGQEDFYYSEKYHRITHGEKNDKDFSLSE